MMKKYLVSYYRNGIVKRDIIVLYTEGIENLKPGNIGLEIEKELRWREKADIVLINFWEYETKE